MAPLACNRNIMARADNAELYLLYLLLRHMQHATATLARITPAEGVCEGETWLSKVLLIKIKFIACLLIKMKTDASERQEETPLRKLQLQLLCVARKSVKTISGDSAKA